MKRVLLLTTALALAAATSAFGLEISVGAEYSVAPLWAYTGSVAPVTTLSWAGLGNYEEISIRGWPYPMQVDFGGNYTWTGGATGYWNLGISADWWFLDRRIGEKGPRIYLGAGMGFSFPVIGLSARLPAGLRWSPVPNVGLETYVELVPTAGFIVIPGGPTLPVLGGQAGIGIRYWFTIKD